MAPQALHRNPKAMLAGRRLATPAPGEEVVITGCSGYYPESEGVYEFGDNLFNKVDMVTHDERRWKLDHPEIPQRSGKIKEISKFDASFFGVHFKQAHTMDPMCRMLLERAYEACVDAGVNPKSLRGSRTGVFIGACFSESEKTWFYEKLQVNGFGITGCSRAMLANRISYWLGVNGPSYTVDSACSSSLYALEHAYKAIRDGHCDSALVGGSNLCLHPYVSLQFSRLGVLSPEGMCRSFDDDANGYARSEAVVMILLQKTKDARRIYGTIVHAKTNCDGYKEKGITYPSGDMQMQLLREFYEECQIDPATLGFLEAHGTGTKVGDPEELNSLDEVFCSGRQTPLPIGSIKSNIGHTEPASGLCSITKCIIAMETGFLPPNLHYQKPRSGVEALVTGMLQVVTEKQPWDGGLVGVNSFGFGGANCHVLLRWNEKAKIDGGAPKDGLPRLVVAAGRSEEAVRVMLRDVESRPVDVEFVKLLHEIHASEIPGHIYRGYTLLVPGGKTIRSLKYHPGNKRPVWYVFSGMGSQWPAMGRELLAIPVFAAAIDKCHKVLSPKGVDIRTIIGKDDPKIFDNILNSFVGIAAVQIGLVDVLTALGIVPDGIVGHSVGELGCAYADGTLTAEQMVLCAYSRGLASIETEFIRGAMAAVGLGYEKAKEMCPQQIEVACHNGPDSSTISGPFTDVRNLVSKLGAQGIFAKEVNCSNIAYHSRYIAEAGPKLLQYLKEVIPEPKKRSSKWVSSSVPQNMWNTPLAKYSSAEYHTNNLLQSVLFEEASRSIPQNAIAIEIAPHGLLQAILRKSLNSNVINIPLTLRGHADNVEFLFTAIGKMYENGITPQLANLYPEVKYPVSRGTPMISPLVKWEHLEDWYVTSYRMQEKIKSGERNVHISMADDEMEFYSGHVIDGRNLFPATGYLTLVWESISMMSGQLYTEVNVVFENVRFLRATNIPKEGSLDFTIMVQKGSGNFEVVEGGSAIVTGRIYVPENVTKECIQLPSAVPAVGEDFIDLGPRDIYKELRLRGYNYSGLFRGLVKTDVLGRRGRVLWLNNWVAFMDNMLQMEILDKDTRGLFVPTSIEKLVINVKQHMADIQQMGENNEMDVQVYPEVAIIKAGGVEIRGLKASAITRRKLLGDPVLEKYQFVPHEGGRQPATDLVTALRICVHLTLENQFGIKVKAIELADSSADPNSVVLANALADILGDLPLITSELTILSTPGNSRIADVKPPIVVEDRKLSGEQNCLLVLASNILAREEVLAQAVATLMPAGAILARERLDSKINLEAKFGLQVIADIPTETERIILLRKGAAAVNTKVIKIAGEKFAWLPAVQEALGTEDARLRIILVAEQEPFSGIVGLVNCIRKEPGGERVRCVFVLDRKAPPFSLTAPLYKDQLLKDLAINVYKDGHWGSYRHLALPSNHQVLAPHAFLNVGTRGDLSTIQWYEGHLGKGPKNILAKSVVQIYYAALNFRDVMTASGKLAIESLAATIKNRLNAECVQGLEYSGRTNDGRRVMGMVTSGALANMVVGDEVLMWDIPDDWSMEDAATVPIVYGTAYYALIMSGGMAAGDTVLIHAGSGGVGQAAIQLALYTGCTVFTTVGTPEKRAFIRERFPQVEESHVGNSRDCSFEQMVMLETNGRGVDLVLNSLAEEKLQASLRCLARGGRFLEIGKFDLSNNNPLGMEVFMKETSFHGIMLDNLFYAGYEHRKELFDILEAGIRNGAVKPLTRTIFQADEGEKAFRYMAAGKHIGKVLISIRPEEHERRVVPSVKAMLSSPRMYYDPTLSYIIAGGLGGFGLELTDWLVVRGARKIVLTSRKGLKTGYQASRVRMWRGYGCEILISTADITTEAGVTKLFREANKVGPVGGIFNLAVVLEDALMENQTREMFVSSAGPKAVATHLLDRLSREMCPVLRHFVAFSSVSCGRGNAGQTNYGMSNSVMERICETRVRDGLPGLAVQWGAVGEVGLVAEMQEEQHELVIGGTLQQRIMSCLNVMDEFMKLADPVLASMVVAEKRSTSSGSGSMVDCVTNIIGIRDLKTVSAHSTLAELGMDSMMAVEIKQTLEREFELFLTPQDIRSMTFARLAELAESSSEQEAPAGPDQGTDPGEVNGMDLLMRVIADEMTAGMPVVLLPSLCGTGDEVEDVASSGVPLFMVPGIEGMALVLAPLARHLKLQAHCLQLPFDTQIRSVQQIAESMLTHVRSRLPPGSKYNLLGYSYGGLIAMELAVSLEKLGHTGNLVLVDSSPDFIQLLAKLNAIEGAGDDNLQLNILCAMINLLQPIPIEAMAKFRTGLLAQSTWHERVEMMLQYVPDVQYSKEYRVAIVTNILYRIKSILKYQWTDPNVKITSPVTLIRPTQVMSHMEEDCGLSKYCEESVQVHFVDGNHATMLENKKCAGITNKVFSEAKKKAPVDGKAKTTRIG